MADPTGMASEQAIPRSKKTPARLVQYCAVRPGIRPGGSFGIGIVDVDLKVRVPNGYDQPSEVANRWMRWDRQKGLIRLRAFCPDQRRVICCEAPASTYLISGLFLLAMAPSPFLHGSIRGDLVLVAVIGVLTFGARALRAAVRSARVEGQEKKAGYPTLQGRKYQRYWQLDPRTGSVVRRPRHR
jgi:hypothetical protein